MDMQKHPKKTIPKILPDCFIYPRKPTANRLQRDVMVQCKGAKFQRIPPGIGEPHVTWRYKTKHIFHRVDILLLFKGFGIAFV